MKVSWECMKEKGRMYKNKQNQAGAYDIYDPGVGEAGVTCGIHIPLMRPQEKVF